MGFVVVSNIASQGAEDEGGDLLYGAEKSPQAVWNTFFLSAVAEGILYSVCVAPEKCFLDI